MHKYISSLIKRLIEQEKKLRDAHDSLDFWVDMCADYEFVDDEKEYEHDVYTRLINDVYPKMMPLIKNSECKFAQIDEFLVSYALGELGLAVPIQPWSPKMHDVARGFLLYCQHMLAVKKARARVGDYETRIEEMRYEIIDCLRREGSVALAERFAATKYAHDFLP